MRNINYETVRYPAFKIVLQLQIFETFQVEAVYFATYNTFSKYK